MSRYVGKRLRDAMSAKWVGAIVSGTAVGRARPASPRPKVSTLGVPPAQYKGLHNAKDWAALPAANNLTVNATPAVGVAAVDTSGTYGHVAYVANVTYDARGAVVPTGPITVAEYNKHQDGTYGTRTDTGIHGDFNGDGHVDAAVFYDRRTHAPVGRIDTR